MLAEHDPANFLRGAHTTPSRIVAYGKNSGRWVGQRSVGLTLFSSAEAFGAKTNESSEVPRSSRNTRLEKGKVLQMVIGFEISKVLVGVICK
jgi:hypothetical protein